MFNIADNDCEMTSAQRKEAYETSFRCGVCYGDLNCTVINYKNWIIHADKAVMEVSWDIGTML